MKHASTLLVAAAVVTACAPGDADHGQGTRTGSGQGVEQLRVQVEQELPHDETAFTQGLEFAGDTLYEGTGRNGQSKLTAGPAGGPPERSVFGEGITVTYSRVWQLTWTSGVAI